MPCISSDHPSPEQLAAWIDGGLPPDEYQAVGDHLADCYDCYVTVANTLRTLPAVRDPERSDA